MIAVELGRRMVEGLFAPTKSAREVLSGQYSLQTGVQFVILAYVLQAMLAILIPGARGEEAADGLPIGFHVLNLIAQFGMVGVIGFAIWGIGRLFGGAGTREQALIITAWHTLVTVLLAPFFLGGTALSGDDPQEIGGVAVLLFLYAVTQYLWTLACYTKELHGFSSPWGVLGVMVAFAALFGQVLIAISS